MINLLQCLTLVYRVQIAQRADVYVLYFFFVQAEDGIRDLVRSRGLGDVYKRQVPLLNADQHIIGILSITRDITETIEMTIALEQKNIELQKINKELESINYISSHDLQEPLRQIQVFGSRISDSELQHLSDAGQTYFKKIINAAKRMQNLINDLLVYSRTKTDARKFTIVNLNQIINEVIEEFGEIISDKHATVEVAELGDANIVPFQFRQMMYNLIGNALKFSKPDTPPHITIKNKKVKSNQVPGAYPIADTEYYQISITDNGIGFEPQYKDRIFEVFQRLHDKQKIAGTGIGLAIVKTVSYTHLRAHETVLDLVCRLLLEKKKKKNKTLNSHTTIQTEKL